MNCRETRELLPAMDSGDLPPETADAVQAHLDECADCRDRSEDLEPETPPPAPRRSRAIPIAAAVGALFLGGAALAILLPRWSREAESRREDQKKADARSSALTLARTSLREAERLLSSEPPRREEARLAASRARTDLAEALRETPASPEALRDEARAWKLEGRTAEAVASCTRAIAADGADAAARLERALLRWNSHRDEALEDLAAAEKAAVPEARDLAAGLRDAAPDPLQRAAQARPWDADVQLALAHALSKTPGREDDALKAATRAAAMREGTAELVFLARLLVSRRLLDEAGSALGKAFDRDPKSIETLLLRAGVREKQRQFDMALLDYGRILDIDPNHAAALAERGRMQSARGRRDDAGRDLNRAVELAPELPIALLYRGEFLWATGKAEEGLADVEKAGTLDPKDPRFPFALGSFRMQQGDFEAAEREFGRAITLDPRHALAHAYLGVVRFRQMRMDEAAKALDAAVALDPKDPAVHYVRGTFRQERREFAEAEQDYTAALALESRHVQALAGRALCRRSRGDFEAALKDATDALRAVPDAGGIAAQKILCLQALGRNEEAAQEAQKLAQRSDQDPNGPYYWAISMYNLRRWTAAMGGLRRTLQLETAGPRKDYVQLRIWIARTRRGEREDASRELEAYLQERPTESRQDWVASVGSFLLGKTSEEDLRKAADAAEAANVREHRVQAWFFAATRKLIEGDAPGAAERFRKSLDPDVWHFTGYGSAVAELAAIEKGAPGEVFPVADANVLFNECLQYLTDRNYAPAMAGFRKILDAFPDDPLAAPSAYNIACGHALQGQTAPALDWLEKSVALGFNRPDHMEEDSDLESLRGEERFKQLVEKLRKKD